MDHEEKQVVPFVGAVNRDMRAVLLNQKSSVFWFTGLSGSGKSTIAHRVEQVLYCQNKLTYVFDGDNVRHGLCSDLSFSPEGRSENIRRIAEMLKLFIDAGVICMSAFISPYKTDREKIRQIIGADRYYEIYVKCPVEICEQRDVKGFYKMARAGQIKNYTGISSPYEEPMDPHLILETDKYNIEDCCDQVLSFVHSVI